MRNQTVDLRCRTLVAISVVMFIVNAAAGQCPCGGREDVLLPAAGARARGPLAAPSFVDTEVADVVYLFDGSCSIGSLHFEFQKDAIRQSIENLAADGSVAVAVIQFTNSATIEVPLTVLDSPATVQCISATIDQIQQLGFG